MAPIKSILSVIVLAPLALAAPQDVGSGISIDFSTLSHFLPGVSVTGRVGPLTEPQGPATASTEGLIPTISGISQGPGPVVVSRTDLISATISTVPSGVLGSEASNLASASMSVATGSAATAASQITASAAGMSTSLAGAVSSQSNALGSAVNSLTSALGSATSSIASGSAPKETGMLAGAVVAVGGIVGVAMAL